MTPKQMKEWLSQAQYYWLEVEKIGERKLELEALREKVTPTYSLVPGGGGGFSQSKIENITVKILALNDDYANQTLKYLKAYNEIKSAIALLEAVNMKYVSILNQRYLDNASWEDIGISIGIGKRQVIYLHDKAVAKLCVLKK